MADKIISENAEFVISTKNDKSLTDLYLKERVVTEKFRADAMHIAIATINKVDILTS